MAGAYDVVSRDVNAICYSIYYYKEYILRGTHTKTIAVDGIAPDKTTISNNSYPYVVPVYASIRSDLDKQSMAYKLYELLQTEDGKRVIAESGYVPN
jgi:phosphate transport system substrate-binding protein